MPWVRNIIYQPLKIFLSPSQLNKFGITLSLKNHLSLNNHMVFLKMNMFDRYLFDRFEGDFAVDLEKIVRVIHASYERIYFDWNDNFY